MEAVCLRAFTWLVEPGWHGWRRGDVRTDVFIAVALQRVLDADTKSSTRQQLSAIADGHLDFPGDTESQHESTNG